MPPSRLNFYQNLASNKEKQCHHQSLESLTAILPTIWKHVHRQSLESSTTTQTIVTNIWKPRSSKIPLINLCVQSFQTMFETDLPVVGNFLRSLHVRSFGSLIYKYRERHGESHISIIIDSKTFTPPPSSRIF